MWGGGYGPHFEDDGYSGGIPAAPGAFTRQFRCYPVSFIDRSELEKGDKIVLPPSALNSLSRLNIQFPMYFQLESREGRKTHCGVLEFVAEEGHCYLPYWLMQHLLVAEGDMLTIRNAQLQKGTFVKFQPQSSDFLAISNPKAVLEATLRSFTCLTTGDSIAINYNSKIYWLDVLSVAPDDAISIIEADVNVEFAAPKDYVEPEPPKPVTSNGAAGKPKFYSSEPRLASRLERLKGAVPGQSESDSDDDEPAKPAKPRFPGSGQVLKPKAGRVTGTGLTTGTVSATSDQRTRSEAEGKPKEKKPFEAFSGEGRTLRG